MCPQQSPRTTDTIAAQMPAKNKLRDSFTQVPHYLVDQVMCDNDFPHYVVLVCLYLLRKTVGWNKKTDSQSYANIANGCHIGVRQAKLGSQILEKMGIFRVKRGHTGKSSMYTFLNPSADEYNAAIVKNFDAIESIVKKSRRK